MVNIIDIYEFLNISIGIVMKNPGMLKLVPYHLKTKNMCKYAVKKLSCLLRCILDQYKTPQMYDKDILENGGTFKSVPGCCKNYEMCNEAVYNYSHVLKSVPVF